MILSCTSFYNSSMHVILGSTTIPGGMAKRNVNYYGTDSTACVREQPLDKFWQGKGKSWSFERSEQVF